MRDKLARTQLARAANGFRRGDLPCLILMSDDARLPDPRDDARALPEGSAVILRGMAVRYAREMRAILGLKLLIANDGALAAQVGADGIHLSEANARHAMHWRTRHPNWLITAAAHSLRATTAQVDAVLLSPVFPTHSHPHTAALGIRALMIAQQAPVPAYALGGVDAISVRRLDGGAFAGVVAVSALA